MLSSIRRRTQGLKRAFAIALLGYALYVGWARVVAIMHADTCLDSGGHYDERSDSCRH